MDRKANYYYTLKISFKTGQLPEGMKKLQIHAFLVAGPVSFKKKVRINAPTIP